MARTPCCEKVGLKRGKWSSEEDEKLVNYIKANGEGSWRSLPTNAGLLRCGKSCRLRWINYLREDVRRGNFSEQEEETIVKLHETLGNKWSVIAGHLPGRTDNEIKNYWNSHLRRKLYIYRWIGESTLSAADMTKMMAVNKTKKRLIGNSSGESESSRPGPPPTNNGAASDEGSGRDGGGPDDALSGRGGPLVEVDDEILMHLNYFLEDEETPNQLIMNNSSSAMDYGGWSDTCACYSSSPPALSYFTDGNAAATEQQEEDILIWS